MNEVHFNDQYPEYKNVVISNMRDKYGKVYDGKKWIMKNKTDLIDDIYDDKKRFVEEQLENEEIVSDLTKSQLNALNRWLKIDEDDDNKIKKLKSDIMLEIYNNRASVAIK